MIIRSGFSYAVFLSIATFVLFELPIKSKAAVKIGGGTVVSNANDSGPGSLRQAVADVATGGTITFDSTFFATQRVITLVGFDLTITRDMTINGSGANLVTIVGPGNSRVFRTTAVVTINGLTITGGNIGSSNGSGISNNGTLTVSNCHITGNTAAFGGGISNTGVGSVTLINSTVSGNTSMDRGGGIDSTGTLTVNNSTISGNTTLDTGGSTDAGGVWARNGTITNSTITNNTVTASGSAGGLLTDTGTVTIRNTIIAGNSSNSTIPDVLVSSGSTLSSNGFNLIGNRGEVVLNGPADQSGTGASPKDPLMQALQMNGGLTPTHALLSGSPALDAGNSSGSVTDQRGTGFLRIVDLSAPNATGGDGADIGAYEAQAEPASAFATVSGRVVTPSGLALRSLVVTMVDPTGARRSASTSSFGIFTFDNVPTGNSYILNVSSKRFRFAPQTLTVNGDLLNVNITGLE